MASVDDVIKKQQENLYSYYENVLNKNNISFDAKMQRTSTMKIRNMIIGNLNKKSIKQDAKVERTAKINRRKSVVTMDDYVKLEFLVKKNNNN